MFSAIISASHVTLHHHEACDPVAWPETLVSLVAKAKLECTQKRKFRCLPACLFVTALGINPGKNAFPKSSLPTAALPKATLLFSLLLPAVKLLMEIPPCITPRTPP